LEGPFQKMFSRGEAQTWTGLGGDIAGAVAMYTSNSNRPAMVIELGRYRRSLIAGRILSQAEYEKILENELIKKGMKNAT